MRTTRYSRNPVLAMLREADDGDPWGTAMMWAFALCECLDFHSEPIPAEAQFRWGAMGPTDAHSDQWPDCEVWDMYGTVPTRELTFALRVILRYLDWLKAAGLDY